MSKNSDAHRSPYAKFTGPNLGYVMEMYELFKASPEEVDAELVDLFTRYGPPPFVQETTVSTHAEGAFALPTQDFEKLLSAHRLVEAIRGFGHLASDIYPLQDREKDWSRLELEHYGLTEQDLANMPASLFLQPVPAQVETGLEAIQYLLKQYTGKISYEFSHITNPEERNWLQSKIEQNQVAVTLSKEEKIALLDRLTKIEGFEKYIHRTFVGAKRFSIEGLDTLVVLFDEIVRRSEEAKTEKVLMAMAHRGRLNVLTHVLNKPYEAFFALFAGVPDEPFLPKDGSIETSRGWTGDVVYHFGATYNAPSGTKRFLGYNPSHLEVINPVIAGQTRAAQEVKNASGLAEQDPTKAFAIMVHGDAAFAGQGVVPETFNFSHLRGFQTGGSIHIISNNMIGFTTEFFDSRSTRYASDSAKGYEVPIIHVNADCPESVLASGKLAFEYRQKFGKDIVIDLIGYRRFGHNEMDEPLVTNPLMYHLVHKHPTVRQIYGKQLEEQQLVTAKEVEQLDKDTYLIMQQAHDVVKNFAESASEEEKRLNNDTPAFILEGYPEGIQTGIEEERLRQMNEDMMEFPEYFKVFDRLVRILKRREEPFKGKGKIDWAHAEALAFGSILQDGNPIRMTGQDVQRGTFAHRHLVLHDEQTGDEFVPLHQIKNSKASFNVYNSPLTEEAIVGYEFGYNIEDPQALTVWEAQYGDFSNMAQAMFDQFLSSSRSKWGQQSGLVLLLPHAHEGQGPEHTSARLERFLQLSAEHNWTVANISNAANYFHVLRRQALTLGTPAMRPLILMSPKSLLRHPLVAADVSDLTDGHFHTVLEQPGTGLKMDKVERVILASGKMAIDLAEKVKDGTGFDHIHIIRVEQLYPFPDKKIRDILSRYTNATEVVWVQEEPRNMGVWSYIRPQIERIAEGKDVFYIGRIKRASPSEGNGAAHALEQKRIIAEALNLSQD